MLTTAQGNRLSDVMVWTGTAARALRKAMRLSQSQFAERAHVDQRTISSWECRGDHQISAAGSRSLDDLLDSLAMGARRRFTQMMNPEETTDIAPGSPHFSPAAVLTPSVPAVPDSTALPIIDAPGAAVGVEIEKEDEVNRREFGAASGIALLGSRLLPDRPSRLGLSDVRGWIAYADELEHRDQREGGAGLVHEAGAALSRARHHLDSAAYDPATATAAASAVGNVAVMTGWVAYDADQQDLARTCYRQALELAARSGDDELTVHALLKAANQEVALTRRGAGNPHLALQNASRAGQIARRWKPGRVHALIAARKAQAWALIGSHDGFRTAMTEAHLAMDTALESELLSHCPQWLRFVDPGELAGHEARGYSRLGEHRTALDLFERALQGRSVRNQLIDRAWYATTLASVGDLPGAITEADPVLAALAGVGSTRTLRVLAPIRKLTSASDNFAHQYDQIHRKAHSP